MPEIARQRMARASQMNIEAAIGDGVGEVAQAPGQEHCQAEGPGHDAEEQRQILQPPASQDWRNRRNR